MKSIIKIAVCIVVALSSFSLQSCKKENIETVAPINKTVIGKWRAVSGNRTIEREFIKGASETQGVGNSKFTEIGIGNAVTVTTAPFNWDITSNGFLHISQVADIFFKMEISPDGKRMLLFDEVTDRLSFTFERI